ncbi:MAG: 16S rRNA (adenine(1518)-N(6)/adenine(1519)-N(6))-dimethyltransferase RsmA [Myxococcota bacterium]
MPDCNHPKTQLLQHNLNPLRQLGQNFLCNDDVLYRIAQAVAQHTSHIALEWGPGLGAFTHHLLTCGLQLHTVERDQRLLPLLQQRFAHPLAQQQLKLHHADARTFDIVALAKQQPTQHITLCGNLPYNIASRLLVNTAQLHQHVQAAFYLVQKEVAQRVCTPHGNKNYGLLSVLVQLHGQARILYHVPATDFWPIPKVDAAVIQWLPHPKQQQPNINFASFAKLVRLAFATRRKKLANTLAALGDMKPALNTLGLDNNVRAEQLSVQQFVQLHHMLIKKA